MHRVDTTCVCAWITTRVYVRFCRPTPVSVPRRGSLWPGGRPGSVVGIHTATKYSGSSFDAPAMKLGRGAYSVTYIHSSMSVHHIWVIFSLADHWLSDVYETSRKYSEPTYLDEYMFQVSGVKVKVTKNRKLMSSL